MKYVVLLFLYWATQGAAQAFFGFGASASGRWLPGFVIGNLFGGASVVVLMGLYARGDVGLACALGVGGGFVAGEIALAILVARRAPTFGQCACILMIAAGMAGYALLAKPTVPTGGQSIRAVAVKAATSDLGKACPS